MLKQCRCVRTGRLCIFGGGGGGKNRDVEGRGGGGGGEGRLVEQETERRPTAVSVSCCVVSPQAAFHCVSL